MHRLSAPKLKEAEADGFDVAIVGCFYYYYPGLKEAREVVNTMPVDDRHSSNTYT